MRSLVGGVAATAAVRAWPFRVYSLPSQPKLFINPGVLKELNHFLKTQHWADTTFNYGGVPLLVDELCPPGKIYDMSSLVTLYKSDVKVCHPETLHQLLGTMRTTCIDGITI